MIKIIIINFIYVSIITVSFLGVAKGWAQSNPSTLKTVNTAVQDFSVRSENMISGHADGVMFSSEKKQDGSFEVFIKLRNKAFKAVIPTVGLVKVEAWFIKSGKPAKLTHRDIFPLVLLYKRLDASLNENIDVEDKLDRFITGLLEFYPVGEDIDGGPVFNYYNTESTTNICDEMGERIKGEYSVLKKIGNRSYDCPEGAESKENGIEYECTEYAEVGPYGQNPCLGRCGRGCNNFSSDEFFSSWSEKNRYTQECFNHDLCVAATGAILGPCAEEFWIAFTGWMRAPVCNSTSTTTTPTKPLKWYKSRSEAAAAANREDKLILLIGGIDKDYGTAYMKSLLEYTSPPIRSLIDQQFVPWYWNVDSSTEGGAYVPGCSFTVPLICCINPKEIDTYLDRTTGIQTPEAFYARLKKIADKY